MENFNKEWLEEKGCATIFLIGLIVIGLVALEIALGVWLWKIIMVGVFGLPALSFWQFFGLVILLHILLPTNTFKKNKE